jgi:O-acetyl-ADP-ribose deacetylase (regulator of RNase III)
MPLAFDLALVHPDEAVCEVFRDRFRELPRFRTLCCRYEQLGPHDAFVTAGNAYGIMTAGIDAAVVARHGEALMERVQDRIRNEYLGEQPVGTAFLVETGDPDRPFLVHAPTMRTPGCIAGTDRVYAATWAALLAVYRHNVASEHRIRSVVVPAMGAGFGGVPPSESARQMAAAWKHFASPPYRLDWDTVVARERAITVDGGRTVVR